MNNETDQNNNPSDRNESIKAFDKKPYMAPNITFIEDLEVVAGICKYLCKINLTFKKMLSCRIFQY